MPDGRNTATRRHFHGHKKCFATIYVYINENSLKKLSTTFGKYRVKSKDEAVEKVGADDKRVFIELNRLLSGYKGTRSFLKAGLSSM